MRSKLTIMALLLGVSSPDTAMALPICGDGIRISCVVDGDTFWLDRVKYRIADIDAPEVSEPKCRSELELGRRATIRLSELLEPGKFDISRTGTDRYGRTLAVVSRDGQSIGDLLIKEGLARKWSGRREPWC